MAMNAESTVFRSSRPAVVVAPGGEGVRAAVWLLAWPLRLAATPLGRRLLVAAALALVAVAGVGFLYDTADPPGSAASFRPAGLAAPRPAAQAAATATRRTAAAPAGPTRAASAAEAAAAWWAARQRVAVDKVRSLQQRRVSATETEVLVVAEAAGSRMPSEYVTVRKGPSGWAVP
jgi:hypothetical protein